jgi:hypothetical protein
MAFNNDLVERSLAKKRQVVAVLFTIFALFVISLPSKAVEVGVSAHQGAEYETQGYSVYIANNFSRRSPFYWSLGISRYDEVYVEWNSRNLKFPINNAEAALSYRHAFNSRNRAGNFSMEYQVGVATALTENKFTWPDRGEEKYFSETGDINGFVAISAHYKVSSNFSAYVGVKHFPKMSEFGSLSSAFLGVKFNFSAGPTYYGN